MLSFKKSCLLVIPLLWLVGCSETPPAPTISEKLSASYSIEEGLPFSLSIPHAGSELFFDQDPRVAMTRVGEAYELSLSPTWFDGAEQAIKRVAIPLREKRADGRSITHLLEVLVTDKNEIPSLIVLDDQVQPKSVSLIKGKEGRFEIKAKGVSRVTIPFSIQETDADSVELSRKGSWPNAKISHVTGNTYMLDMQIPQESGLYRFDITVSDHDGSDTLSFGYQAQITPQVKVDGLNGVVLKKGTSQTFQYRKAFDGQADSFLARLVDQNKVPFGNRLWSTVTVNQTTSTMNVRIDELQKDNEVAYLEVVVKNNNLTFKDYYLVNVSK